jgi:hypothetical protein
LRVEIDERRRKALERATRAINDAMNDVPANLAEHLAEARAALADAEREPDPERDE